MGFLSNYIRKLFPPYYRYVIYMFVGFEFVYVAFTLSISEPYYKAAREILPIAYRMFNDTVMKNMPYEKISNVTEERTIGNSVRFDWTEKERANLELYKNKLFTLWVVSIFGILICMLTIIPQFFDYNDKRGNPSQLCLVSPKLAWIMFFMVAIYVIVLGCTVFWIWWGCTDAVNNFHSNFDVAEKDEKYVTQLEEVLHCTSDDDKEGVEESDKCWPRIKTSFSTPFFMDILLIVYVVGHILAILLIPVFNRQLVKQKEEYNPYAKPLVEES